MLPPTPQHSSTPFFPQEGRLSVKEPPCQLRLQHVFNWSQKDAFGSVIGLHKFGYVLFKRQRFFPCHLLHFPPLPSFFCEEILFHHCPSPSGKSSHSSHVQRTLCDPNVDGRGHRCLRPKSKPLVPYPWRCLPCRIPPPLAALLTVLPCRPRRASVPMKRCGGSCDVVLFGRLKGNQRPRVIIRGVRRKRDPPPLLSRCCHGGKMIHQNSESFSTQILGIFWEKNGQNCQKVSAQSARRNVLMFSGVRVPRVSPFLVENFMDTNHFEQISAAQV